MKMTEQVLGSVEKENRPKKAKSFWGLFLSKLGLQELVLVFRSVHLAVFRLILNLTELILIIFGDPAKSFNLLYKQHGLSSCTIPYAIFKTKQKHAKVFSLAGIITIVLVTAMSSLLVNLMVGPIEKTLAATFYWTQASWVGGTSGTTAVHNTDNDDWTYYASKDAGITAGASLTVTQSSADWTETSDADFNSYTSKDSILSVGSNSITLLKPNTATCGGDSECLSGVCTCDTCADAPLKAAGVACGSNGECCSNLCDTVCVTALYVFVTPSAYDGNLGGRSGADSTCVAAAPAGAQNVHALLSVSTSSEIRDLPGLYGYSTAVPIYWYNLSNDETLLLANDWSDMCSSPISNTQAAGTGVSSFVWTGSNSTCAADVSHYCGGFTKDWPEGPYGCDYYGRRARYNSVTGSWLDDGYGYYCCDSSLKFRCIFSM